MENIIFALTAFLLFSTAARAAGPQMELAGKVPAKVAQYEMLEIPFSVEADFSDPYDPDDIRLDATVTGPDGTINVPGFFADGTPRESSWKLRFTPRSPGSYMIKVTLENNEGRTEVSDLLFRVSESNRDGFLNKARNGSPYYFQFDSGRKFRGVGENFGWESRGADSTTYNYDFFLPELASKGVNMIRTWMCPWNLPLIWKKPDAKRYTDTTKYRYNQPAADYTDMMLKKARENGIYVILVLDYHGALKTEEDYWGGNNYWPVHPYNVKNGGSAKDPADYFTAAGAREQYKKRLRYIIARWGAYTSLGTIEFWNEIDNAMADENIPPEVITAWHGEMGRYLDAHDPYNHLVTTSVSHRHIPGMFGADGIDYSQIHLYGRTNQMHTLVDSVQSLYPKPVVVGEIGYDWKTPADSSAAQFIADLHKSFWSGMFEPTPVLPLPWWWEFFYERTDNRLMRSAADFSQKMVSEDWSRLEVINQPRQAGLESKMLGGGEYFFAYLKKAEDWKTGPITLDLISAGRYRVQGYDTQNGNFFDYPEVKTDDQGRAELPATLLVNREDVALILKRL